MKELEDLGAAVYAVAPDTAESLRKLAEGSGLGFPVLRDPDGKTIVRYGIRNERWTKGVLPDPTALVIDREGKVRWKRVDVDYTKRPPAEDLVAAVRALGERAGGGAGGVILGLRSRGRGGPGGRGGPSSPA